MRWEGERESTNVEDRRGGGGGTGGFGVPLGRGGIGLGTIVIALVGGWLLGINPLTLLGILAGGPMDSAPSPSPAPQAQHRPAPDDRAERFSAVVLASTEDVWSAEFARRGARYEPPVLVIYDGRTHTACGAGSAASGPFYCPADRKVYLDLGFFRVMREQLGAGGEFAQAYVIAHEVGHHLQNLAGTSAKMQAARERMNERQFNALSVRVELQADCYAGVWAKLSEQAKGWLDRGDVQQAIDSAASVGDDRLQKRAQGVAVPDSFTHGSSEQRTRWFRTGLDSGRLQDCDTFSARAP